MATSIQRLTYYGHTMRDFTDTVNKIIDEYIAQSGEAYFGSTVGTIIPLQFVPASSDPNNYYVEITPSEDAGNNLGDMWVVKQSDRVIVYNSGTAVTKFNYRISGNGYSAIKSTEHSHNVADIASLNTYLDGYLMSQSGTSTFNSTDGTTIPLQFTPSSDPLAYEVIITPTEDPGGYLGEIWVVKSSTDVKVYNSGTATTGFRYRITNNGRDAVMYEVNHRHTVADIEGLQAYIAEQINLLRPI